MKKFFTIALLLGVNHVFAAGYGTAGCGLGSLVIGSQPGFMQVFAATTNGTSGSQTFGITSGTSNCAGGGKTATQFIDVNKASLLNDAARGDGQTLSALSEIYGCKNSAEFSTLVKSNYSTIFATKDTATIDSNIQAAIKTSGLPCKG